MFTNLTKTTFKTLVNKLKSNYVKIPLCKAINRGHKRKYPYGNNG